MTSINSPGIGSGLDVQGLVEKLVTAEGGPVSARLDRKEAKAQAGLSAMGTFKSALAEFQTSLKSLRDPKALQAMSANSDNEETLTVSAGKKAQPGEYDIEVNQLAQSQRLTSVIFDSDDELLGGGKLKIQLGSYDEDDNKFKPNLAKIPQTIEITEDRSSLREIQRSINEAGVGLRASIVNNGIGHRLVISSEVSGAENSLKISVEDNDINNKNLAGLSLLSFDPTDEDGKGRNMVVTQAAMDAEIEIDGITIRNSSNSIDTALDGVTLEVKETGSAEVRVFLNKSSVVDQVWKFVEQYNAYMDAVDSLTGYNTETRQAGPLNGDSTVRSVTNQIRRLIGTPYSGLNEDYVSLASIGLKTEFTGKITLDTRKLNMALEDDIGQVVNLFANSGSTTDPRLRFVEASDRTAMGAWDVNITQKPTKGGYAGLEVDVPVTIHEGNDQFSMKVDGLALNPIRLTHKTYDTGRELAAEIQTQINSDGKLKSNGGSVKVSYYDDRFVIVSERFGSGSMVEVTATDFGVGRDLGLAHGSGLTGKDVAGSIGSFRTLGVGTVLTGQQDISGLKVEVSGGAEGKRGKVIYSRGVAAQLDDLMKQILDRDGVLQPRMEGFNTRLEDITDQRDRLARKLEKSEQRYLKQFTELDALIGKMSSTGNFLTNQLSGLPGMARSGK